MTPIYQAENAIDAQLLLSLLEHERIAAHVTGTDLLGAIGELPAQGLVRVWVNDADHDRARQIIAAWLCAPIPDEDELVRLADGQAPDVALLV